jgi:hypothetical protein
VEGVLKALAARFDEEAVKIDQTVFNAARITKAYGTVVRKGDDLPERPHRLSRILDVPTTLAPVPREFLEELIERHGKLHAVNAVSGRAIPAPALNLARHSRFNIDAFLAQHLQARPPVAHEGGRKWVLEECPVTSWS